MFDPRDGFVRFAGLVFSASTNFRRACAQQPTLINQVRPHIERKHLPPVYDAPEEVATLKPDEVEIRSHVGGLLKSFYRKAA